MISLLSVRTLGGADLRAFCRGGSGSVKRPAESARAEKRGKYRCGGACADAENVYSGFDNSGGHYRFGRGWLYHIGQRRLRIDEPAALLAISAVYGAYLHKKAEKACGSDELNGARYHGKIRAINRGLANK